MAVQLRVVNADDWLLWRPVRRAALTDAPDAFGSRLSEWNDAPESSWRERLSIPGALELLAIDVERDVPVGMATGLPAPGASGRAGVISLWVDPAARGRGVASALLDAIARWAADGGAEALALSVMPGNDAARRVYERNGFALSDELGSPLPDGGHEIVMIRELRADPVGRPRQS